MTHSFSTQAALRLFVILPLSSGCGAGEPTDRATGPATSSPVAGTSAGAGTGAGTGVGGMNAAGAGASGGFGAAGMIAAGTGAAGLGGSGGSGGSAGASPVDAGAAGMTGQDAMVDAGGPPDSEASDAGTDAGATIGQGGTVEQTIVVASGETFDGQGRRYVAGSALGDGSQSESQKPVFRLEHGARLVNVVLGAPAADGIHTYGDVALENIVWEDVGEDALTIKAAGEVTLDGGSATLGEDKIFQINAASTFRVSNFTASHAGKFIRQNGGTTFRVDVFIDGCDISDMDESIFRTDSSVSRVTMTNTRYSNIGRELFMGVSPANIRAENNQQY